MLYLAFLLSVAVPRSPTHSVVWGFEAHKVVCEIAWRRLDDAGRELVSRLMESDSSPSFAESCLWADAVKRTTHSHTRAYHYINIPPGVSGVDMSRDCADAERGCVTWAIPNYALGLQDTTNNLLTRREALKFLGHFVGDIHQPLHAGRPGDLGGNRVEIEFFGEATSNGRNINLHGVWDYLILNRADLSWPEDGEALNNAIDDETAALWKDTDVIGWTNESYRIADEFVYRVPEAGIGAAYYEQALRYLELRMQQAGIRLAFLINEAAVGRLEFAD